MRLMGLVGKRDPDAFAILWRREVPFVRNSIRKMDKKRTSAEIEEIIQEVGLALWKNGGKWRGDCALESWLYYMARSQLLMFYRRKHLRNEYPQGREFWEFCKEKARSEFPSPFETLYTKELFSNTSKAFLKLENSTIDKRVFLLHVSKIKNKDISKMLDVSYPAVKSKIHRMRRDLKGAIEGML